MVVKVPESHQVGNLITRLPLASDPDFGPNSRLSYKLRGPNTNFFHLTAKDDALELVLIKPLDREQRDKLEVQIFVFDFGENGSLNSTLDLLIEILDVNDNAPEFFGEPYPKIRVREDVGIYSKIFQVNALDNDTDVNGEVHYKISTLADKNSKQAFRIDAITGEIYLISPLDYETTKEYFLPIIAYDGYGTVIPSMEYDTNFPHEFLTELISSKSLSATTTLQIEVKIFPILALIEIIAI